MDQIIFCVNCGQKLASDVNFCPRCGTKIVQIEEDMCAEIKSENIGQQPYPQYKDQIEQEVLDSYLNDTQLIRNALYTKGLNYNYTNEMIDEIISGYERRINEFVKYLEKLYTNGSLLMLDVTDEIKNESARYAEYLGLEYDEGEAIYEKYVKSHRISAKYALLMIQLLEYRDSGCFDDDKIEGEDLEIKKFKQTEYLNFKSAIEEIAKVQKTLHEKSNEIFLSEDDQSVLYTKAQELGIPNKDHVAAIIVGNERRLGFHEKAVEQEINRRKTENKNKFSKAVCARTVTLFRQEVEFSSCYFAEKYTKDFFESELQRLKRATKQKYLDAINGVANEELLTYIESSMNIWMETILKYFKKLGLAGKTTDNLGQMLQQYFQEAISSFYEDMQSVDEILYEIESGVNETIIKGKLNKAFRGRWAIGGFGVKGMVGGAITGCVLNAGTGLAYDAINGITTAIAKNNSKQAKEKLIRSTIPILDSFFDMLILNTPIVCISYLYKKYPYCVWIEHDEEERKLNEKYNLCMQNKESDAYIEKLVIELLLENPYNSNNYGLAFLRIRQISSYEQQKKDVQELMKIAKWFEMEESVRSKIFENVLIQFDEGDIRRCEELLEVEKLLERKNIKTQKLVYDTYLDIIMNTKTNKYTIEDINGMLEILEEFNEKYEYSTSFQVDKLRKEVFSHYCIDLDTNHINKLQANLSHLRNLNENCSWDLYSYIDGQEEKLKVQEEKLENLLRIRDIKSRTLNIICQYDISTNTVSKKELLAETIEEKEIMLELEPQIIEECRKISFDMSRDDFEEAVSKINSLCEKNKYDAGFIEQIIVQWNDVDKSLRTVKGVEYATREQAKEVLNEIELIDAVYNSKNKSILQKYFEICQFTFKTEQAKKSVMHKGEALLKYKQQLEGKTVSRSMKSIQGSDIRGTVVAGVIGLILFGLSGLIWKIFGILLIVGAIVQVYEKYQEIQKENERIRREIENYEKELKQFNSEFHKLFKIVDSRIVLK